MPRQGSDIWQRERSRLNGPRLVMFEVSTIGWTATLGLIGALIAVDLWHSRRGAHAIALREAAGWSAFYVGVAVLFGVTLARCFSGPR